MRNENNNRTETRVNGGWSLMELVVVLAIIAILAAIITPMINSYVDRARASSARNDVRNIATAVISFNTDTRLWPIYVLSSDIPNGDVHDALETVGDTAALGSLTSGSNGDAWLGFVTNSNGSIAGLVNENSLGLTTTGTSGWNGAYLNDIDTDPWGTKYYFNGAHLKPGSGNNAVFVLSPGPNKTIDTEYAQAANSTFTVGDDDVVQRIR